MEDYNSDPPIQEENDTDWRLHPGTRAMLRALVAERNKAFELLKGACAASDDPNVRQAYAIWNERKAMCAVLEGKKS